MTKNKHEAVWDWMMQCPKVKDLFFNFSDSKNGDIVIVPITSINDMVVIELIDGSTYRQYDYSIIQFREYTSEPNDKGNIEVLIDVEGISKWIENQNEIKNYPDFPPNCSIQKISVLPDNSGSVAAFDEYGAKYILQFRIEYIIDLDNKE